MKIKWLYTIPLLTLFMTGCTMDKTPGDLLRAPVQDTTAGTITQTVKPFLPSGAHLTVPVHSDSGSAIQLKDLDHDGKEEIVAFYKTDRTDYEVNVMVLSQTDGDWKKLTTITGVGSELDYVKFVDVSTDKCTDMLLGFSGGEGLGNELSVYRLKSQQLVELFKHSYESLAVGDITNQGVAEIVLTERAITSDNQQLSNLELYRLQDGQIKKMTSRSIDGIVEQLLLGKSSTTTNGLFLDVSIGAHSSYTALLMWENGGLADILATDDSHEMEKVNSKDMVIKRVQQTTETMIGEHNMAIKDYSLVSKDINRDGIYEIGFLVAPTGNRNLAPLATPYVSKYYQWDGHNKLKFVSEWFDRWGFQFRIPTNWTGKYTVEVTKDSPNTWENILFVYKNQNLSKHVPLITLRLLTQKDWAQQEAQLQKDKTSYIVLSKLPVQDADTAPQVTVAVLPSAEQINQLSGHALQEYRKLQLSPDDVRRLSGPQQESAG